MSDFRVGEIVDVAIKGARVVEGEDDGVLVVDVAPDDGSAMPIDLPLADNVTVERVAPAEWPPQPGDLWKDRDGTLWFAVEEKDRIALMCDSTQTWHSGEVGRNWSPLTLVHREDDGEEYKPCGCDHHGDHAGCYADCVCAS